MAHSRNPHTAGRKPSLILVDPLLIKIEQLLHDGQPYPLNQARQHYGTQRDIEELLQRLEVQVGVVSPQDHYYVDLTPFERVGRLPELVNTLRSKPGQRPVMLVMSRQIIENLRLALGGIPITVALFGETGELFRIEGGSKEDAGFQRKVAAELASFDRYPEYPAFRRRAADEHLTNLLYETDCLDVPLPSDPDETRRYIDPRYYRVMPNNMLVSSYVNLKKVGRDKRALIKLAYEVVLELIGYFRRDRDPLQGFDYLVSPNNTALFLAALVQAILEKPVIAIDRLGPIPSLQLQSAKLRGLLGEKKVTVIEHVVATGSEVDRTLMFLNNLRANVRSIVAVYDLEVGKPMLAKPGQLVSLCRPKSAIDYVYRSQ